MANLGLFDTCSALPSLGFVCVCVCVMFILDHQKWNMDPYV